MAAGDLARVTPVDWQALFFDAQAQWPARLMARARRRYGDTPDAEAAYNHALEAVSHDDWARLRDGYRGTGSPEGFLAITFLNLIEEYSVRKYGRRRAPAWIQRLGGVWPRVYELLCLKRAAPETIVDQLCARPGPDPALVRRAIAEVRGRVTGCGERLGEQNVEEEVEPESSAETPASALERSELGHLLAVLGGLFARPDGSAKAARGKADPAPVRERIAALETSVRLATEERLMLRLIYEENCTIPEAARSLSLNERTARRMHERLMTRLHEALARHGFDEPADVTE